MKHVAALIAMIGIASAAVVGVVDCTDNVSELCNDLDTVSVTLHPLDDLDQDVQKRDPRNVPKLFSGSRPGSRPLDHLGKIFGQDDPAETEKVRNQRDLNDDLDKRGFIDKGIDIAKKLPGKKPDDKKPEEKKPEEKTEKKPEEKTEKKPDDKKPDDKKQQDSNKSIPNGQGGSKDKDGNNPGKKLQNVIGKDSKKSAANMAVARPGMLGYLTAGLAVVMVVAGLDVEAF